jgi:integrase
MQLFHRAYRNSRGALKKSRTWTVRFYVNGRRFEKSLGTRDKSAAEMKAAEAIRAEELRAAGIETHLEVRDVAIADLIDEYEAEMTRRGRARRHVQVVESRLHRLTKRVSTLTQITPERIRRVLGRLDLAPRTVNFYRQALHQFFAWLVQEGRWTSNPVDAVQTVQIVDKTRERRALTTKELKALLKAAPPPRDMLYLMAATTGLRRGELRALTWGDIDLEAATVTIRAGKAKNRRDQILPLPAGTVERLLSFCGTVTPAAPVFTCNPRVEVLKKDLAAAGIEYETAVGVVDFHALRVTFGTSLARAGVPLALAQKLLRHSTPMLTANIYTRLELHDEAAAVAKIDVMGPSARRRRRS